MSENGVALFDHILVPRAAIPADRVLSFELFVKVSDRFIKVANSNEVIDEQRIQRYLGFDRDVLYIDRSALERFMDEKFATMYERIEDTGLNAIDRFQWFVRCLELCFIDLKIVNVHPDKFMRVHMLVEAGFNFFKNRETRRLLVHEIFKHVNHPLSKRAIMGTGLMLNMFLDQNDCTQSTYRSLFIGGLFRDFGLKVHAEDPHSQAIITDSDIEAEFVNHPVKSLEILKPFNLVDDISHALIEQHHERPRGNGFPRGLTRIEIYPPAQYMSLCDLVVTEMERVKASGMPLGKESFLNHVKEIMPEEDRKNLPLLLRAVSDAF